MKSQMTPGRLALWSLVPVAAWVAIVAGAWIFGDGLGDTWVENVLGTVLLAMAALGLVGAGIAKVVQIGVTSSRRP